MAGLISPATLEQIRAASDIVDVIGSVLPLKRAGANFTALCPFHKEKTPSFNVNPHRQIFHCFGCHKGGDVFTFVKEYENLTFIEAVKRLAERAKIPLEFDQSPGQKQAVAVKDALLQIHEQMARRWQNVLANEAAGQVARDYLRKRGVSDEAIQLFRIGAAPEAWDDTVNWAKSKGHDLSLMEQSGLIIRKEDTGRHYDRFRGRLMFPICDEQGRVIAFSGRVLSGDEKTAKYVNSPETPIFTKGKVFYGLDKSKRAILDAGFAVICEGQLDLIACFMAGVKNIVAPQGTAFTPDHARILKRYVQEVVLCFDADLAGQNASVRGLDGLLSAEISRRAAISFERGAPVRDTLLAAEFAIRVAVIPSPHDPDSFIKQFGAEAFQRLINGAKGFFDFYLDLLCASNDLASDNGRINVLWDMAQTLLKTGNYMLLDKYAQKTAARLGVSSDAVRIEFKKVALGQQRVPPIAVEAQVSAEQNGSPPSPQELQLLRLLLNSDEHVEFLATHLKFDWLPHPDVRRLVKRRLQLYASGEWHSAAAFLDEFLDDVAVQSLLTECLASDRPIPNPQKQLSDVLLYLRNQFVTQEMDALMRHLGQPDVNEAERLELLRRREELRQLKRQAL